MAQPPPPLHGVYKLWPWGGFQTIPADKVVREVNLGKLANAWIKFGHWLFLVKTKYSKDNEVYFDIFCSFDSM